MKKWVLGLGAIVATVGGTFITERLKPTAIPEPLHQVIHPEPSPPALTPADLGPAPTAGRRPSASRSWCQGLKEQSDFRKKHFGEVSQSIRDTFNDNNCAQWGIRLE